MKKKFIKNFIFFLIIILSTNFLACPGFIDRGLNIDEYEQCFIQVFEKGKIGSGEGEFNVPWGIHITNDNKIYIADTGNSRIVILDNNGNFQNIITDENLIYPTGVAVTNNGIIYVSDKGNNAILRFNSISDNATIINNIDDKTTPEGLMNEPEGIDVDPNNNYVVVADTKNRRIQIYSVSDNEWKIISVNTSIINFSNISDVAFDNENPPNIYLTEKDRHRVTKLSNTGTNWYDYEVSEKENQDNVYFIIGKELDSGNVGIASSQKNAFNTPRGITVFEDKFIFIADTLNNRITQLDAKTGKLIEIWESGGYSSSGGRINYPVGISVDNEKSIYIVEIGKSRIRKFIYDCEDIE